MPEMDGPTFARKALEIRPELKIVACSGGTHTALHYAGIAIVVFMQKPINLEEFIKVASE